MAWPHTYLVFRLSTLATLLCYLLTNMVLVQNWVWFNNLTTVSGLCWVLYDIVSCWYVAGAFVSPNDITSYTLTSTTGTLKQCRGEDTLHTKTKTNNNDKLQVTWVLNMSKIGCCSWGFLQSTLNSPWKKKNNIKIKKKPKVLHF